jgi:hypothetical protein
MPCPANGIRYVDYAVITKSVCVITNCDGNEGSARTKRISAVSAAQAHLPGLG